MAMIKFASARNRIRFLILLALGTGMRKGEMLSLRYEDIRNGKIYVDTTMSMPTHVECVVLLQRKHSKKS